MDKKTKTIAAVVLAAVVIGGVYYGVNRWRQQQLANQILKEVYGLNNTGGLMNKITGAGGSISDQMAKEMAKEAAKEEAKQKTDEAKEAAKTPEDRYNETEEMPTYDSNSKTVAAEAKNIMEKVFGKAKLTSISTNIYTSDMVGSALMEFTIARLTTGADLGELNKAMADNGLPILQSGIDNKTATVMAGDNETAVYSFGFEIGGQTVSVNIMKMKK